MADDSRVMTKVHQAYALGGRTDLASNKLDLWLKKFPDDWIVQVYKGQYLLQQGKIIEAEKQFQYVLDNARDNVVALNNLAWIYYQQGKPEALSLAEKAYAQNNQLPQVVDTYGWLLAENGKINQASEVMKRAVILAPTDLDVRYRMAVVLYRAGKPALAKQQLQSLIDSGQDFNSLPAAKALLLKL